MRLLLVEDDPDVGQLIQRGLSACGHDIVWQREGRHVLSLVADGDFSATLIDLGLPDCDGLKLCQSLRNAGSAVPVLMLTARGTLQDRLDGFAAGADDYLPKPFAFDELIARLTAIVRRNPKTVAVNPHFGNLSIDVSRGAATLGDDSVTLSRREFALLSALVAQGGAVVSRTSLARAVWGTEDVSENSLDVYISYLRRRLAAYPGAPTVGTVRGIGFRLMAPKTSSDAVR